MPHHATDLIFTADPPTEATALTWRVHLLQRHPKRLPGLMIGLGIGLGGVWLMSASPLMVLLALVLLVGACSDYLFPLRYRITAEGVFAEGLTSRYVLRWPEVKRALPEPAGLILTPLATPSRLDAFRGVLLRYASDGEPGDRTSVCALLRHYAPALATTPEPESQEARLPGGDD